MSLSTDSEDTLKRWTAKRRTALILEIVRGDKTVAEAARKYSLTVGEIEECRDRFLAGGVERNLIDLNTLCEIAQLSDAYLLDNDIVLIRYIRHITQYYTKHFANRGHVEIPDSFTDSFLMTLSPFLFERLHAVLPEKTDDRALDRIRQYTSKREI